MRGRILPAVDIDVHAAYPAAFSLCRCWDYLCATKIEERSATVALRKLARRTAKGDFSPLYDPDVYRYFGLTLAEVIPDGEPWPVEVPDERGIPHLYVTPIRSKHPMSFTWPDVQVASLLSRREPNIVATSRLVHEGRERVRPIPIRDGLVVSAGEDPVVAGVRLRSQAQAMGDDRLADQLRVYLNALAWGLFGQMHQRRVSGGRGRRSQLIEEPAEWTWPPIASTVPAVVRMWMAMVDRQVSDRGGHIIARDTDGLAVLSLPNGGRVTVGERSFTAPSWAELAELLAPFDGLDPFGDRSSFWKIERATPERPLHLLSLAPKRYVKARRDANGGWEVIGGTEHSLGGGVVDPPTMAGRDEDRRHLWTFPVADLALRRAVERSGDADL